MKIAVEKRPVSKTELAIGKLALANAMALGPLSNMVADLDTEGHASDHDIEEFNKALNSVKDALAVVIESFEAVAEK